MATTEMSIGAVVQEHMKTLELLAMTISWLKFSRGPNDEEMIRYTIAYENVANQYKDAMQQMDDNYQLAIDLLIDVKNTLKGDMP